MSDISSNQIVKVIDLEAPIAKVWRAISDYREFGQWFRVKLDQPFIEGGISTGYITYPGHEDVRWFAVVERLEAMHYFSFRWYDSDDPAQAHENQEPSLLVEFEITSTPSWTRLTITESGFAALPNKRRVELMRQNAEGWDIQAKNVAAYLT